MADPDLHIRGGGGHPVPEKKVGGGHSFKKNFLALLWSKNKGGGVPGPLPWIHHLGDFITGSSQWLTDRQQ